MLKDETMEYLFHQGTNYRAYDYLGAHKANENGHEGFVFRCYAPRAESVSIVGDFNDWDKNRHRMIRDSEMGIWQLFIEDLSIYDSYKYVVTSKKGKEVFKSDPYAVHNELRPGSASKLYDLDGYKWGDKSWINYREKTDILNAPVNIYECHIGSWKKHEDGNFYSYRDFTHAIIPYIKDMGYTHIELMGIAEYPFDGSWGYQVGNYFGINSRYGTPHDFMYLVDSLHQAGIGIILDWVPGHFPKDEHGLYEWDGEPLYEPCGEFRKEHKDWGTRCFDYGRNEVQSFLVSNADYWFRMFHIDGLRVDAVASMLYLDYSRKHDEWQRNEFGGNENIEAIAFFRKLNSHILSVFKGVMMIAEESTSWPLVTRPPDTGGLGFNFKWNMGWMNDTISYMSTDPFFRKGKHNNLTFSMMYAFSENFILSLSHDEVVHGKCSLINKMPGEYEQKFANLKTYLSYMMSHPGKKLLFMGSEFGQFSEWDFANELDWMLLGFDAHVQFRNYVRDLNRLYLHNKEFYEADTSWDGFKWLVVDDSEQNIIVFKRIDKQGNEIVCVHNFAPVLRENYRIPAKKGKYTEILNSDSEEYGGTDARTAKVITASEIEYKDEAYSMEITIPPLASVFLKAESAPIVIKGNKKPVKKEEQKEPIKAEKKETIKKAAAKKAPAAKTATEKPIQKKSASKKTPTAKKDSVTAEQSTSKEVRKLESKEVSIMKSKEINIAKSKSVRADKITPISEKKNDKK